MRRTWPGDGAPDRGNERRAGATNGAASVDGVGYASSGIARAVRLVHGNLVRDRVAAVRRSLPGTPLGRDTTLRRHTLRGVAMVIVHIVAGSLALIAGMTALLSRKGDVRHRQAGLVFAIAMLVMTSTGAVMAALKARAHLDHRRRADVLPRRNRRARRAETRRAVARHARNVHGHGLRDRRLGYAVGFDVTSNLKTAGWAPMFFVFASIALASAAADLRLLRRGTLQGCSGSRGICGAWAPR